MVRDEQKRTKASAHGKRGGNPTLKATLNPTLKRKENPSPPSYSPLFKRKEKKDPPYSPPIANNSNLSQTEKGRLRVFGNSPLMFKVGELFNRNQSTLWTIGEAEALSQISPSDKELALLKNYYSAVFPKG